MLKLLRIVFVFTIVLSSNILLFAQEASDQAAEMQMWMEYMTPGPMHNMLANQVGEWKTISKYWMDPSGEPMTYDGLAKTEMILGGRYQKSNHSAVVMVMPMEGISLIGYDNTSQEFTSVWIDNLGTGTAVAKGKYDQESNSIAMIGTMIDPMAKSEINFKQNIKFFDDNHFTLEMYLISGDKEFKSMEIEFVRQ
ncbi:MAG: DUF1579 domain-containing protein [Ignavibacteriaceae bacterium]|nr:DUF1579 domain-containing protein [Ignavibacteriaceae bacterium]